LKKNAGAIVVVAVIVALLLVAGGVFAVGVLGVNLFGPPETPLAEYRFRPWRGGVLSVSVYSGFQAEGVGGRVERWGVAVFGGAPRGAGAPPGRAGSAGRRAARQACGD